MLGHCGLTSSTLARLKPNYAYADQLVKKRANLQALSKPQNSVKPKNRPDIASPKAAASNSSASATKNPAKSSSTFLLSAIASPKPNSSASSSSKAS